MSREYPCVYFDHEKCTLHGTEPENIDWCVMGPCGSETPSNADHIRSMTDEELANILDGAECPPNVICQMGRQCTECVLEWLKQPYKEKV